MGIITCDISVYVNYKCTENSLGNPVLSLRETFSFLIMKIITGLNII